MGNCPLKEVIIVVGVPGSESEPEEEPPPQAKSAIVTKLNNANKPKYFLI